MKEKRLLKMLFVALLILSPFLLIAPVVSADDRDQNVVRAIYAFKYGEVNFPNYGVYWMGEPRFSPNEPPTRVFMFFWLIQTATHNILVDTGTTADFASRYAPFVPPETLLRKIGLSPSDIDTVIVSHPHFDHVDGIGLFKNATVYIQRAAYRFVVEDAPEFGFLRGSGFPRKKDAATLLELLWDGRLKLLDGDTEIFPGIKTIRVDGHHPGLQITVIKTSPKPVILASDAVHQYVNLEKNVPMGLYQGNLRDVAKALEMIRQMNGIVVAGHDKQVLQRFKMVEEGIVKVYPF